MAILLITNQDNINHHRSHQYWESPYNTPYKFPSVFWIPGYVNIIDHGLCQHIPDSISILYAYANIKSRYNSVSHTHCSAQPSLFSHVLLRLLKKIRSFKNSNDVFTVCRCSVIILFSIILNKVSEKQHDLCDFLVWKKVEAFELNWSDIIQFLQYINIYFCHSI